MADDIQFEFTAQIASLLSALGEAQTSMETAFTGMEAKIEEVSEKLDTSLKGSVENTASAFNELQAAITAVASVAVVEKLTSQFNEMAERGAQILHTAEAFNVTTQELQGLQAVAATASVGADRLRMMMTRLGNQMTVAAETEAPAMLAKFENLGITLEDLQNPAFTVIDAMDRMAESGASNAAILQMFSRNGAFMIEVVHQLAGGMDVLHDAADRVGALNRQQVEQLKAYHGAVETLDLKWQNLKATWLIGVLPALNSLVEALSKLATVLNIGPSLVAATVKAWELAGATFRGAKAYISAAFSGDISGGLRAFVAELRTAVELSEVVVTARRIEERPDPGRGITSGKDAAGTAKREGELQQEFNALFLRQQSEFQRQVTADLRTESAERSRLIKEGAEADLEAVTSGLTLELDAVHAAEREKLLSPQQEYAQTVALLEGKLAAQHAYYARLLTDATLTTNQIIALQNKEAKEEGRLLREEQKAHEQLNAKLKAEWAGVTSALETSMAGAIKGMLAGTESFGQAMRNIFVAVFDAIISKLIQWVITWIENLILAAVTNKVTAGAQVIANASVAATAAMASVAAIPFYGWAMAPEVGAATYLEAMAYLPSAASGWEVPRDTLAMVHKDEKILPAAFSQGLDQLIKGGGGGGELHAHVHVTAIDTQSGAEFIQQNIRSIASGLSRELSKFNPALRR